MLNLSEAKQIRDVTELNDKFRGILKPGDWTHVRDPMTESRGSAAYLCLGRGYGWLGVGTDYSPKDKATMIVFKIAQPKETDAVAIG